MPGVFHTCTLAAAISLSLAACGGGEEADQANGQTASLARTDADAEAPLMPTAPHGASAPGATEVTRNASAMDTQIWAERAAINRSEVEQPTTPAIAPTGSAVALKSTATAPAFAKAITAPEASIYRFLNSQTGSHLYTRSVTERDTILNTLPQYRFEGPVFGAWQATTTGLFPVYRFANTANGTHFFTISETEKNNVLATAPYMHLEGAAYYASKTAQAGTTPLYRFYHLQKGFHFYTASATESQSIQANLAGTYKYEGVGYYVNATIGNYDRALAAFVGRADEPGYANGSGEFARFSSLWGMAFNPSGELFVAESLTGFTEYSELRKVSPNAMVSNYAGSINGSAYPRFDSLDGAGTQARFHGLRSVTFDSAGNAYVGDFYTVRRITLAGMVTTIAGNLSTTTGAYVNGQAPLAKFMGISGIALDSAGNLLVSDTGNHAIRKISPGGVVSTLAGSDPSVNPLYRQGNSDGSGSSARFNHPGQIAIDSNDNLYVADSDNHRIRKVSPAGMVTTLAGRSTARIADGVGSGAYFHSPFALTIDRSTGDIYTSDWPACTVRKVTPDGTVSKIIGTSGSLQGWDCGSAYGTLPTSRLGRVGGLAVRGGRLYVASNSGIAWTNLPQ